ncbi:HAD-IA family hydrolase [Candidatus Dojkabacteria bacterium]|nr:HAD-IA family hydrolase [Candidatus Dojkabacteria bacterium]
MNYKAVLLDLDDTLIASNKVYDKALKYSADFLAEKYSLDSEEFYELAREKYSLISHNFPTVHTRHSRILLFRLALDETAKNYDIGVLPVVEDIYWDYFLQNVKVFPEVKETLKKIKEEGVLTAVVSDGDLSLRIRKVQSAGLLKYIDEVVASEEVIFEKPFSAIFTLALSRLGVDPHEAVMVGNNYKNDIRGAKLVGIKAGVFSPEGGNIQMSDNGVKPDFVMKKFSELLKILSI